MHLYRFQWIRYSLKLFFWVLALSFKVAAIEPSVTLHVPMSDGMELTTDLFYPPGVVISNEYPCVLVRLPGGRKAEPWVHMADLAREGYVIAIQDTRSALDKEGKTLPFFSDGWGFHQDGYDTVNWLAASSFTNGKIGTMGFSAAGITQILLAPTAPQALKCQYIGQAPASLYHQAIYSGGRFQKNQVELWFSYYAPHPSALEFIKFHSAYNDLWQTVNSLPFSHKVCVPAFHYGGWFDPFLQGTLDEFHARQIRGGEGARGNQKLLIGPWNHFWPRDMSLGDFEVPENGRHPPLDVSAKQWFDHYLKGMSNKISDVPAVTYFVMGPFDGSPSSGNIWRHADAWPVAAIETPFYLMSDEALSEKVSNKNFSFTCVHDPKNPVPTVGGRNLFLRSGPKDQRSIESRQDVLVFTSPPLEEDLEVTGHILSSLYISAHVSDLDIVVRLTDVYPDGKSLLIADGLSRIDLSDEEKGKPQQVDVDLWSTSLVFAKGHSIRISIAGSNYPRFEKNPQEISLISEECRLLVGEQTPSCIFLPLVRKGVNWLAEEHSETRQDKKEESIDESRHSSGRQGQSLELQ